MALENEITAKLSTVDLSAEWEKLKGRTPNVYLDIRIGARTDLGRVRENNEDKFEFFEPEEPELLAVKGSLYAVADGMGGHASGQIASDLALKNVVKMYYADPSEDAAESLRAAVSAANAYIYSTAQAVPDRNGMGTTCTVAVMRDDRLIAAHVGDSRLYRVRDGELCRISEDHSWVEEQVKMGALTREEAEMSPFRNVITRSLGIAACVEVDIYEEKLEKDDIFVLCSDGLSGYVREEDILSLVTEHSPAVAAMKLVDRAFENGGGDNITVLVASIADMQKAKSRLKRFFGLT
jgi:protein phosphatase